MTAQILSPQRDSCGRNHKQMRSRARKQAAKAASRNGEVKTLLVNEDTENLNPNEGNTARKFSPAKPSAKRKTPTKLHQSQTPTATIAAADVREEEIDPQTEQTPQTLTATIATVSVQEEAASQPSRRASPFPGKSNRQRVWPFILATFPAILQTPQGRRRGALAYFRTSSTCFERNGASSCIFLWAHRWRIRKAKVPHENRHRRIHGASHCEAAPILRPR
jgi:hypothetical protein